MKHLIYDISKQNSTFYCLINGQKVGFYLTKSLQKIFLDYLEKGHLVEFEINDFVKPIGKMKYHQVSYFTKIERLTPYQVLYDIEVLRNDMRNVISKYQHYLFVDFEMTMPGYQAESFQAEIIQFGAVLTDNIGQTILEREYYIKPKLHKLSMRTIKYLDLHLDEFNNQAKDFEYFYLDLKDIISKYEPKIVVWGKNDIIVLNKAYESNNLLPITNEFDFFNLLVLHKDYFNMSQEIGLFKAYQTYFPDKNIKPQKHDAKDDANVTKAIFFEFLKEVQAPK